MCGCGGVDSRACYCGGVDSRACYCVYVRTYVPELWVE